MQSSKFYLCLGCAALFIILPQASQCLSSGAIPTPSYLAAKKINQKKAPIEIANCFLRIPYRRDGTLDERGRFTTFERPDRVFRTPGLNCSGLVLSLWRYLSGENITIDEARRDRQGNSGPDSPLGKNWDFGWDLILNLTEGVNRRVIMPDGRDYHSEAATGETLRGFNLQDQQAWKRVLDQIRPGYGYLASFSKHTLMNRIRLHHYHVAVLLADGREGVWLYQTTRTGNTYRVNLGTPKGMRRFREAFRQTGSGIKKILIIEAKIQDRSQ